MDSTTLRAMQAPLKERYRSEPETALVTLRVTGTLDPDEVAVRLDRPSDGAVAGLHPATGGSGAELCSADMLLEALAACGGVTLRAVSTALDIPIRGGSVTAEGEVDFRGTLGVGREAPVGFKSIRLSFTLDTDAPQEKLDTLLRLTERYCVVLQTLKAAPGIEAAIIRG